MGEGFQFIDIIFFAMIAAFLVLRLRSVLGRRDGNENQLRNRFKAHQDDQSDDNVVELPDQSESSSDDEDPEDSPLDAYEDDEQLFRGLSKIMETDPRFQPDEFLSGSRMAFELILGAYAHGDAETLKPLLSPEVYANFAQAIRDREQAGETLEDTLVGIKSADIVEAYVENKTANINVKFVSEQINATRDENGDVVDGDPNAVVKGVDFWTFARHTKSRDPNWTLVATSSLD
ncbi:MAG: Tim44 domain-containing protein [Proteobacteria bacterium]|nr:Tim44 domain-containing protein [Pseudomonadota bacterium]